MMQSVMKLLLLSCVASYPIALPATHTVSLRNQLNHQRTKLLELLRGISIERGKEFELLNDRIITSSLTGDFYQSRSGYVAAICGNSSWCAWSDVGAGHKLSINQDGYVVRETDSSLSLAVFDGISTAAGGEVATEVAINTVKHSDESLHQALDSITAQLQQVAQHNTTVSFDFGIVAAGIEIFKGNQTNSRDSRAVVSHVGDVRLLHIRDGEIKFHTLDHNPVYDEVINGRISADEYVSAEVYKGKVSRSLRASELEDTSIERHEISLQSGDVLVLASDAVWNVLTNADVLALISTVFDEGLNSTDAVLKLREVVDEIVRYNNKLDDNFTVIVYQH